MKRLLKSLALALVAVVLIGTPVLAYSYFASIVVTEGAGSSYTMLPITVSVDNTYLVNNNFISPSGLNTRVLRSSELPHMLASDRTLFASSIGANTLGNFVYTLGDSALSSFSTITGYNGYVTMADAAALEFGNNFESEFSGYVDTSAAMVGQNLVYKDGAYRTYVSAAGTIASEIGGSPSGSISPYSSTSDGHVVASGGSPVIENLIPNSVGYTDGLWTVTPLWNKIDDPVGAPDDYNTVVYADLYTLSYFGVNLAASSIPTGSTISSVAVYFRHIKDGSGSTSIQPGLRLSSTNSMGTSVGSSTGWANTQQIISRPGGGAWAISDLANLELVMYGIGDGPGATNLILTQAYVIVTYALSYAGVQGAATGTVSAAAATFSVGQQLTGSTYNIWRSAVYFDTSAIPDISVISSATIKLYGQTDGSTTDFSITVMNGQSIYPHDPLVVGDYAIANYSGNGGSLSTTGFSVAGYNVITFNATGLSWISKTGTTKLFLVSSRDISITAPSGNEYVTVYAVEQAGTANDPQLVVNYVTGVSASGTSTGAHVVRTTFDATNLKIFVDDMVTPKEITNFSGVSVPNNVNNWILMSNAAPYWDYYKHTVGGTLIAWYQPVAMIKGQAYSTGTVTVTNNSPNVVGAGTTWTSAMTGGSFISTDGIDYVISSVTDATNLVLATVYGGTTLGTQAYNMYVRLPDREGATQNGRITWGANPAGITVEIGGLLPVTAPPSVPEPQESVLVPLTSVDVHTTGTEGAGLPLYGMFKSLLADYASLGGPSIPMASFWKLIAVIIGWCFGTAVLLMTRNVVIGLVGYLVGFAVPAYTMGVLDVWVPIVYGIGAVCLSALLWKWTSSSMG